MAAKREALDMSGGPEIWSEAAERTWKLDQNHVDSALADSIAASLASSSFPELLSIFINNNNNNNKINTAKSTFGPSDVAMGIS